MINVFNSKYKLGEYHLVYLDTSDRIAVFDYEHSRLEPIYGIDKKPYVFDLAYRKQLFVHLNKLPNYDLFLSEALCWMATAKLLKLCKQRRIKGLHFDWLEEYKY